MGYFGNHRSWLKQTGDEAIVTERLPPGYTFHYVARPCGGGCEVAVVYRNTYNTAICSVTKKTCVLYPLLANQLTDNITGIVPAITRITNASLEWE